MKAGLAVAEGTWEAQADMELVPHRCACGAVGPDSLMVPVLPLLLFSALLLLIPGLASTQGKPMAACHLMEVL